MRVLIIGGSSLLGKGLLATAPSYHYVISTWCSNYQDGLDYRLDLANPDEIFQLFERTSPNVVIYCAGITSVDFAEKNPNIAYRINVLGVEEIIKACNMYNSYFVNLSTNAVFDGENPPYSEEDEPCPINEYGKSKLQAEILTQELAEWGYLILRPILLYGWSFLNGRTNWVEKAIKINNNAGVRNSMLAVEDVFYQPVWNVDLANIIWAMIDRRPLDGIYHVANRASVSLYELLKETKEVFGLDNLEIEPCSIARFASLAPRPKNTSFSIDKIERLGLQFVPLPLHVGLVKMREAYDDS